MTMTPRTQLVYFTLKTLIYHDIDFREHLLTAVNHDIDYCIQKRLAHPAPFILDWLQNPYFSLEERTLFAKMVDKYGTTPVQLGILHAYDEWYAESLLEKMGLTNETEGEEESD